MGMKHVMMDKPEEEPVVKKQRTEDSLESEEQFLAKHQVVLNFCNNYVRMCS